MLSWNVFVSNSNSGKIESFNIFYHNFFVEDCRKNYKKNKNDKNEFEKTLKRDLMYYFWSKCEWEIIVSHWPQTENPKFKNEKIDVYDQVMLNWNQFVNYLWKNKEKLK